jgi:N-methylhydantoinase A
LALHIGVDVGGTFTDLLLYDQATGRVGFAKAASTPAEPEVGVMAAIRQTVADGDLSDVSHFLYGHTVGLNTLLERSGPAIGLLTTRGFRDTLEIGRGDRADPYDLRWERPRPLVPRRYRRSIPGRILATGEELEPLDADVARAAGAYFVAEGIEAVAICFLHAYANPAHELAAAEAVREAGFNGEISLSHAVSGEHREYERTCTTVIDAYIRPRVARHSRQVERQLNDAGFSGVKLIARSGGGAMSFEEALERPFESLLSGPVGGVEAAISLGEAMGLGKIIAADVGGTSFDTCIVTAGVAPQLFEGRIAGMPVQAPWIDVRSIGAGGGSIAGIDAGGLLQVGPESSGANPGPACYGRGGIEPTVTDAACVLGMLGNTPLAGGLVLDRVAATAVCKRLAGQLGLSLDRFCTGVLRVASTAMADAVREIAVEYGVDLRDASLIAFGGAGPLFATQLAMELDVLRAIVPPYAGNFSAWGFLGADMVQSAARTALTRVEEGAIESLQSVIDELVEEMMRRDPTRAAAVEVSVDLRYVGQEHSLTIPLIVEDGRVVDDAASLKSRYNEAFLQTFGHPLTHAVEAVTVRATSRTRVMRPQAPEIAATGRSDSGRTQRTFSLTEGSWCDFAVVDRAYLADGTPGPLIVTEPTTTSYVDAGFFVRLGAWGSLIIERANS